MPMSMIHLYFITLVSKRIGQLFLLLIPIGRLVRLNGSKVWNSYGFWSVARKFYALRLSRMIVSFGS